MTIDSTSATTATSANGSAHPSLFTAEQSRDMFLKLLVNQIRNQDPLNPQDPTAFVSQLADFSSLEQLLDMRESLQAIRAGLVPAPDTTGTVPPPAEQNPTV